MRHKILTKSESSYESRTECDMFYSWGLGLDHFSLMAFSIGTQNIKQKSDANMRRDVRVSSSSSGSHYILEDYLCTQICLLPIQVSSLDPSQVPTDTYYRASTLNLTHSPSSPLLPEESDDIGRAYSNTPLPTCTPCRLLTIAFYFL